MERNLKIIRNVKDHLIQPLRFTDGESKALKWAVTCLRIHSKWRVRIRINIPQAHLPLLTLLNQDQRASMSPLVPVSSYLTRLLPPVTYLLMHPPRPALGRMWSWCMCRILLW